MIPLNLFYLNVWPAFVDEFLNKIPAKMQFRHLIDAVVAHYRANNKAFAASTNKLVLFGLDEPMKLEAYPFAMEAVLLPVAKLQDDCDYDAYEFVPFVTSLSEDVMAKRVKTSGRQLHVGFLSRSFGFVSLLIVFKENSSFTSERWLSLYRPQVS